MESIELKSTQSRFCDSNVAETSVQTNACLQIESESVNQSILIEEDNKQLETFIYSKDLEVFITNTSKLVHSYQVLQRIEELISKAKERINNSSDLKSDNCFFKRKEPLFTLKSVECFNRIIEKKLFEVNHALIRYFELVMIYETVSELTNDKETLVKLINLIFMLIKAVDCPSTTNLLEYRLQILIKKVLLLNSSDNSQTETLIKSALTPLLVKDDANEAKKSQLSAKLSELVKKKINGVTKKERHDEALKELSDFIKEKFTSSKEHYEILLEPLLEFFDIVSMDPDTKYNIFYEYLCYFVFPLLPNLTYMISKNDTKQEQKPFGLYNPVLMIKNMEVATKTYTLLNFIDNNLFDLVPQFNLTFFNLDLLLSKLSQIFNDENSKSNVNLRFALFVIFKRILLIKEYSHLFKFNYSFAEIEHLKSSLLDKKKSENEKNSINISDEITRMVEGLTTSPQLKTEEVKDFHDEFIKAKLTDIINVHDVVRKISIISLDMFRNKVDSESNEISNFFPYLIERYEEEVNVTFKEFNFDIADYIKSEKLNSLIKYMPSIFSEKVKINQLSTITEGLLNTIYITAGNKKDFLIYVPRNSVFYFTSTITYYDALINVYRYDPSKEGVSDKFILLSKEQKIESDFTPFEITIFSYKPEIYKINIDNTFSWLNGKEIKYKMSILQLSQETKPIEAHRFGLRYKLENFKEQVLNKITEYVFFKYETFLGKNLEDYAKKAIAYNYLNNYSFTWLQKFLNIVQKNKESLSRLYAIQSNVKYIYKKGSEKQVEDKEKTPEVVEEKKEEEVKVNDEEDVLIPQTLQEIGELEPKIRDIHINFIKNAYKKISANLSSLNKGKKQFKLDKLASIDVIIRSYIKNVFVRVNLNEEELEDHTFKSEICKFEDVNDQFIFFNYFYLKQNKNYTLGNYFEDETKNNSNIIFMKFPLVDSCLIYYLYTCSLENSKLPEKAIYFHFDKSLDIFNYSVYSDGEILGDDFCFGEEKELMQEEDTFYNVIRRTIDAVNFRKLAVDPSKAKKKKNKKKKNEESEESEESEDDNSDEEDDDEEEKTDKLRSWKIIVSYTGSNTFIDEASKTIKSKVGELNKAYLKEGKTKKEKKIKTVFKSVEFVCDMTNFMHCFEIY